MAFVLRLVLVVLLVVNNVAAAPPKKCSGQNFKCCGKCYPDPGMGHQGQLFSISNQFADSGRLSNMDIFDYFAYDRQQERFYGRGMDIDENGRLLPIEVIQLNKEKPPKQYAIVTIDNTTKCLKDTPQMVPLACIAEDAWYFGNTTLGSRINNITAEVYVHTARWISDPTKTATVVHVLTENECTPVLSGFHGVAPGGQDRILASLVGNYEAKIDDVSVFDVPSACQGL